MRNFKNKVVVVTGAGGNLGSEFCLRFAKAGAKIAALDLYQPSLDALSEKLAQENVPYITSICNVSDKDSIKAAMAKVIDQFGQIDVLINNAGITHIQRYMETEEKESTLRKVMEVNFFGAVACTEIALDEIVRQKGMIIAISSVAGIAPLLGRTAYAASKHALHGFFESLRSELYDKGVHCMMVCPSFIAPPKEPMHIPEGSSIYKSKKTIGKSISAKEIAWLVYKAAKRNRNILPVGKVGKISYFLSRFLPNFYEKKMRDKLNKEL